MKEKHENATREFTWKNLENRKGDGMGGCFVAPLEEFVAIAKKDKNNLTNVQFSKNNVGLISLSQLRNT